MSEVDQTITLEECEGEYWKEHKELKNELDEVIRTYEEEKKTLEEHISKYRRDQL